MLVQITGALGADWEATSVACEEDALEQLEKRTFDAVLVDFNLGSPDASDLLNLAFEKHPESTRFLLAYEADVALVAAKVQGSPQILAKPIDPLSLKSRIEEGVKDAKGEESGSEPANTPSELPKIPAIYSDVLKTLESPDVTHEQVGELIAQDPALTSEILSLTKSSYLGLPCDISNPVEAVESLGLEAVKATVMALRFLAEHGRLKPGYLSLDQLWQHSINVGQIARDLTLFETKDRALASQALIAGLLHDLGKVVLASNFDDLYGRVHSLARKQPVAIWDIEKEMFGANHGEIGGCLVGMWNMPSAIVEAAALHHEPPLGEHEQLTPLAAVHIANVLERELWLGSEDTLVAPIIYAPYLNELGLLQRLPVWRAAFANQRSVNLEPDTESAETEQTDQSEPMELASAPRSRTANQLPKPVAATRTTSSKESSSDDGTTPAREGLHRRNWVYAGAAALALMAFWFGTQRELKQSEPVYARTPAAHEAPAVVASIPSPETATVAAPQVRPAVAVTEPIPAPAASEPVPKPAVSLPAREPVVASAPSATANNVPSPSVAPKPEFRLSGIFYSSAQPAAIVNGQTVNVGDEVNGAIVVSIERTIVTLQINGQRKTYRLR